MDNQKEEMIMELIDLSLTSATVPVKFENILSNELHLDVSDFVTPEFNMETVHVEYDREFLVRNKINHDFSSKQIESLTHSNLNSKKNNGFLYVEDDYKKYFDNDYKEKLVEQLLKSDTEVDLVESEFDYLNSLDEFNKKTKPAKKYTMPLGLRLKIVWAKFKFKNVYTNYLKPKRKLNLKSKWNKLKLNTKNKYNSIILEHKINTIYKIKEIRKNRSKICSDSKLPTYQTMFEKPSLLYKLKIKLFNSKIWMSLESKIYSKYSPVVNSNVLNYVKNHLKFSSNDNILSPEIIPHNEQIAGKINKNYKKVNKNGKPYRVARIQ